MGMTALGSNHFPPSWLKGPLQGRACPGLRLPGACYGRKPAGKRRAIFAIFFCLFATVFPQACTKSAPRLTFWVGGAPQEIDYWQHLVDEFTDRTGVPVEVIRQPAASGQRKQGLVLALDAHQPDPDLFLMDIVWVDQFVRSDWLTPLNGFFHDGAVQPSIFFDRIIDSVDRYGRQVFALPAFLDVGVLYYRRDLLHQYGFDAPPTTWQALLEQAVPIQRAERRRDPNFNGFVWQGAQYEGLVCTLLEFTKTFGGGFLRNGRLDLTQPQNTAALQFMQDLIHRYGISPPNTYTEMQEEQVRQAFQRGNALFERNWLYAWRLHQRDGSPVQGKVGLTALPHAPGAQTAAALGGWHLGISKYSDAKDQAWRLAAFLLSKGTQKKMLMRLGWYSCRKDVYTDPEVRRKVGNIDQLRDIVAHAVSRPRRPYYDLLSRVIQRYANDCLAGKIAAGPALNRMQQEIEKIETFYEPR
jgi:multiple sugar transport system substrate-binding protein